MSPFESEILSPGKKKRKGKKTSFQVLSLNSLIFDQAKCDSSGTHTYGQDSLCRGELDKSSPDKSSPDKSLPKVVEWTKAQ